MRVGQVAGEIELVSLPLGGKVPRNNTNVNGHFADGHSGPPPGENSKCPVCRADSPRPPDR